MVETSEGPVEYAIKNTDSPKKLHQIESEIAEVIRSGKCVAVTNDSDYAVAATSVVEAVKRALRDAGIKVYQANQLEYEPVMAPENETQPLAKRKTHHYKVRLVMKLSKEPIAESEGTTLQETVRKEKPQ